MFPQGVSAAGATYGFDAWERLVRGAFLSDGWSLANVLGHLRRGWSGHCQMDLPMGGGAASELDARIVAWAGRVQLECCRDFALFVSMNSVCKGHYGGTRALNEYGSVLNVLAVADVRVSCACCLTFLWQHPSVLFFKEWTWQLPIVWFVGVVVLLCLDF